MRKLTIEIEPNEMASEGLGPLFEKIHSYEVLETLKIDFEEGVVVDLVEFHLKEGIQVHDLQSSGFLEILSVLKSEGKKHTCLIKFLEPEDEKGSFKEFDFDVIYTTPILMSKEKYVQSVIGDTESLNKFIEMNKKMGKVLNMSFTKAAYQRHDIVSILTDKQKEILIAANKHGYYDYPKKINSQQLADKVNLSKPTLVQHLRKGEGRLMENIFSGYL